MVTLISACGGPAYRDGSRLSGRQRDKLTETAGKYLGSSYKFGGTSANGFDCSGLVYRIYREALGWKLPRTTEEQYKISVKVNSGKARPGDLVFFRINGAGVDHVGMMMNNYQFVHASTSSGVIISDFSSEYYRQKFSSIRRLK